MVTQSCSLLLVLLLVHLETMAFVIPQSLRPIAHYVKIGAENADRDPIIHYWCKFEILLKNYIAEVLRFMIYFIVFLRGF